MSRFSLAGEIREIKGTRKLRLLQLYAIICHINVAVEATVRLLEE